MKRNKDNPLGKQTSKLEKLRQQVGGLEILEAGLEFAESEIRESGEKYQRLFELSPMGIVVLDMKGVIIDCNSAVCTQSGYSKDDFIGKHFSKVATIRARDIPKFLKMFASLIRGKIPKPLEVTYTRKDGTTGWTEAHISLLKSGGKRIGIQVIQNDITERKQAERVLKESEEKYRSLFESMLEGFAYCKILVDEDNQPIDFVHLEVNDAWERAIGLKREDVIGKKVTEVIPGIKESDPDLISIYGKVALTGENTEFELYFEPLEQWLDVSVYSPAKGYFVTVFENITERKKAEESLRLQAEIIVNMSEGVYIIRASDGVIVYTNPKLEEVFGYGPGEMVGKHVSIVNAPTEKSPEETANEIIESINRTGGWQGEIQNIKKDGTLFWCYASVAVFDHPVYGEVWIVSHTDITERKQAEEREKQLQQELTIASRLATVGEMSSGIAHEINNPLTGVIGFSSLLLKKDLPDDIRKDVNVIYEGAQRVARITSRMLTFARQHKPDRASVDINDIVETTLAMRAYEASASGIKVTTKLSTDIPLTFIDASQLQQVFLNIIINAEVEMITAHGKGNLSVKTERIDNTIRVSFKDDGPGIPKKNLDKIFDPFFTTREVGQGSGLGLSVCHGIVTQHGGKIYAQSRFGKGATFFVELPVITKAEQLKFAEPTAKEPERVSKARILVVDDDTIVQQFLTEVLGEEGHEVEIVENGDDALERIDSEDYDVILLDIKLPGMSGIELYKYMQKAVKSLARRVIFITGDVMSAETMVFVKSAQAPYITKPFDVEQLKKEIDRILSQQS